MIGNDVVDLALAEKECNWRRKGYLEKVFTEREICSINSSSKPNEMVWRLWTCKESAYKINHRETRLRAYNPLKFECIFKNYFHIEVIFESKVFYCRTLQNQDFIYTEAVNDQMHFTYIQKVAFDNITKRDNIPFEKLSGFPVSITHHGKFRFAVKLNQIDLIPSLDLSFKNASASRYASLADEN